MNPYISFVACSRNDNHGGSLTKRMQIFVDSLTEQCDRYSLKSELILVEWNPPENRVALAEEIKWNKREGFCDVRIITVPSEIHQRFKSSKELPLYQMIAKNVGIRRAKGDFILCTNIDIIFSDEVMQYFAERKLEQHRFYRSIRMDVSPDVPENKSVADTLEFCKRNIIRKNTYQAFDIPTSEDLLDSGLILSKNIFFDGCFDYKKYFIQNKPALFIGNGTIVRFGKSGLPYTEGGILCLKVNNINAINSKLIIRDGNNIILYNGCVESQQILCVEIPRGVDAIYFEGTQTAECKNLSFNIFSLFIESISWLNDNPICSIDYDCYFSGSELSILGHVDSPQQFSKSTRGIARRIRGNFYIQVPEKNILTTLFFHICDENGSALNDIPFATFNGFPVEVKKTFFLGLWFIKIPPTASLSHISIKLKQNTNCFITNVYHSLNFKKDVAKYVVSKPKNLATKLTSEILKLSLSSNANRFEKYLPNELRLLNGEISAHLGKNFIGVNEAILFQLITPLECPKKLFIEFTPSPQFVGKIDEAVLLIDGVEHSKLKIFGSRFLEFLLPRLNKGQIIKIEFLCSKTNKQSNFKPYKNYVLQKHNFWVFVFKIEIGEDAKVIPTSFYDQVGCWYTFPDPSDITGFRNPLDLSNHDIPDLFLNACGDFTLASKIAWSTVHGYLELDLFSMHLDSLLLYVFYYSGLTEHQLPAEMVHYHIEHGSGWTPEGNDRMYSNLAKKNIPWIGYYHDFHSLILMMRRYGLPLTFNSPGWGLADEYLKETIIN